MKLPYGQSNFKNVATQDFYYVDRTNYIEKLEGFNNRFLFYLRPRKFGKSLFVSMLGHYYGEEWKGEFGNLFGRFYIGKNPTPLANQYLVLNFDFSGILTDSKEVVFQQFTWKVKSGILAFMSSYRQYFTQENRKDIDNQPSASNAITRLFDLVVAQAPGKKIYIVIDEYDHFANELIAFRLEDFKEIVSRNGFVRKFYEVIKEETKTGLVERMFATGVSPVTVDSLTSGFNIGDKVSLNLHLHEMMGFTETEASAMLAHVGVPQTQMPDMLNALRSWYDGYLFNPAAPNSLYNPNMLIYFCNYYQQFQAFPEKMLDENIASDYGKIRLMLGIGGESHSIEILEEVLAKGEVSATLTSQYSFERHWEYDDYVSLLFWLGMMTVKSRGLGGGWSFQVPNAVIKQLYYDYFAEVLRQRAKLEVTLYREISKALVAMSVDKDPQPFLKLVEKVLGRLSGRDVSHLDERKLQAIFAAMLTPAGVYLVRTETEVERSFVDLLLTIQPGILAYWNYAIELKYLKKKDAAQLDATAAEACRQLEGYLATEDLQNVPSLAAFAIVFVGKQARFVKQVN
jgi:hypothetical protein